MLAQIAVDYPADSQVAICVFILIHCPFSYSQTKKSRVSFCVILDLCFEFGLHTVVSSGYSLQGLFDYLIHGLSTNRTECVSLFPSKIYF